MGSEQLGVADEARFDSKPMVVTFEMAAENVINLGAFGARSKEAHVAPEDVEELGEFVEPAVAEEATTGEYDPMIKGNQLGSEHPGRISRQRTELVHGKGLLVTSETLALVNDWPSIDREDQERNTSEKW